jgi:lipopolysaccharide transport system permease protein
MQPSNSTERAEPSTPIHSAQITALADLEQVDDRASEHVFQVIEPTEGRARLNWNEVWRYRELLYFLAWRDIKIRYRQTVLGGMWAVLQPLLTMAVFMVLFGRLAGLGDRTAETPYAIHVFTGLLLWTFFANSLTNVSRSLIGSSQLVTKVYFPRVLIPLAAMGSGLMDLAVSLVMLSPLMMLYGMKPSWSSLLLPVVLLLTILVTAGVGSWLAALTVAYRDFQYVVPFTLQIWMFLTPIIYPVSLIPKHWQWLMGLNPMAGLIDGFRCALLGKPFDWVNLGLAACVSGMFFMTGVAYFRQVERRFADII